MNTLLRLLGLLRSNQLGINCSSGGMQNLS